MKVLIVACAYNQSPYAHIAAATLSYWNDDRDMGIGFARSVLKGLIEKCEDLSSEDKDRVLSCFISHLSKNILTAPELIQDAMTAIEGSEDIVRNLMYYASHQLEAGEQSGYHSSLTILSRIFKGVDNPEYPFVTSFFTLSETASMLTKDSQRTLASDLSHALKEREAESLDDNLLGFAAETLYDLDMIEEADSLYLMIKNAGMGRSRALKSKGLANARLGNTEVAQECFRSACEQIAPKLLHDQISMDHFHDECHELLEQGETHISALGFEFPLHEIIQSEASIDVSYAQEFAAVAREALSVSEFEIAHECLQSALIAARKAPRTHTATAASSIAGEIFLGICDQRGLR